MASAEGCAFHRDARCVMILSILIGWALVGVIIQSRLDAAFRDQMPEGRLEVGIGDYIGAAVLWPVLLLGAARSGGDVREGYAKRADAGARRPDGVHDQHWKGKVAAEVAAWDDLEIGSAPDYVKDLPDREKFREMRRLRRDAVAREGWTHRVDRDHDGDAWQYDHYAVRGDERVRLDVSYSRATLPADEFALHVALDFPARCDVPGGSIGPLRMADLIAIRDNRR